MSAWLPDTALEATSVGPLLQRVIRAWAQHWFSGLNAEVERLYQDDWPEPSSSRIWRSSDDTASVPMQENVQCALASAMLGCGLTPASLQPTDRAIVEDLAKLAIDDLVRRLSVAAKRQAGTERVRAAPIDLDSCEWWEISLGASRKSVKVAIATNALAQMRKSEIAEPQQIALRPVADGLARQRIQVSASLGSCSISLFDLEQLGPGDVIILEAQADEPLALLIDGHASPLTGALDERDGRAALTISEREANHVR